MNRVTHSDSTDMKEMRTMSGFNQAHIDSWTYRWFHNTPFTNKQGRSARTLFEWM